MATESFIKIAMAVMFGVFIVTMFAGALYNGSTDATKVQFNTYGQYHNLSALNNGNFSYNNTNNSVSNFELIANNMVQQIADAQTQLNSQNIGDQILGAFGVISSITIGSAQLLLAVMWEGANVILGVSGMSVMLPAPWGTAVYVLGGFVVALFVVFLSIKAIAMLTGR